MLQLLHLDVSKIDRVLHMGCAWEATDGADDVRGDVGDVRGDVDPLLVRSFASPTCYALVCSLCSQHPDASAPDGRPALASPYILLSFFFDMGVAPLHNL